MKIQKRLAAQILKCSKKKVVFDQTKLSEINEAITKADVRGLIKDHFIAKKRDIGISRFRARKLARQKAKGKRKGFGSRKGKAGARTPRKLGWMNRVRLQRSVIKSLKKSKKITKQDYRMLYAKVKGGFFRSRRHLQIYLAEHKLVK